MPMSPRLLRPISTTHPEAQAWRNAVIANSGAVSGSTLNAVSRFCRSIDAAGIRDRFARLNLFCGSNLNAALVPLYRSTSFGGSVLGNATDTNNGPFVSGDYVESDGLLGATSPGKYLKTGVSPDDIGVATGHLAIAGKGEASSAEALVIGSQAGSPLERYNIIATDVNAFAGNAVTDFNAQARWGQTTGTSYSTGGSASRPSGLFVFTRTSGTRTDLYLNGTSVASSTASVTPGANNLEFYVLAQNNSGAPQLTGNTTCRGYSLGLSMDSSEVAAYDAAWASLQGSLGRT